MLQEDEDTTVADKGKGKEHEDFDFGHNHKSSTEPAMYPPINEDAEETRRVEENLRRWEVAERQRRKAARESQSYSVPSLVSDVSRRASLLFSGRKGNQHSISVLGNHAALKSRDSIDVVPLTQATPYTLRTPSPTRSEHDADPFANLTSQAPISPFDDVHVARDSISATLSKPIKEASRRRGTTIRRPSPPKPLNLPPPRSPPPIFPIDAEERDDPADSATDVRWWHDWLCGCGEGPDRGGDFQAGHTNPQE